MPPKRRLARHVFTLSSAVSLVLCVAVCVQWVRSYLRFDLVALDLGSHRIVLNSVGGALVIDLFRNGNRDARGHRYLLRDASDFLDGWAGNSQYIYWTGWPATGHCSESPRLTGQRSLSRWRLHWST